MSAQLEDLYTTVVFHNAVIIHHVETPYVVSWVDCCNAADRSEGISSIPYLTVTDWHGSPLNNWVLAQELKLKAVSFRITQIWEEMSLTTPVSIDKIEEILNRVWGGEWMGQFHIGNQIHFSELAAVLDMKPKAVLPIIEQLVGLRKAHVVRGSALLIPPTSSLSIISGEAVGSHSSVHFNADGWWSCEVCGCMGNETQRPDDVSCLTSFKR